MIAITICSPSNEMDDHAQVIDGIAQSGHTCIRESHRRKEIARFRSLVLLAFWAVGWAMARKRLVEVVEFDIRASAAAYRKAFAHYNEPRLRITVAPYGILTILFCVFWVTSL